MTALLTRIAANFKRSGDSTGWGSLYGDWSLFSSQSVTGIQVNQQSAMQATAVMACVSVLSEDVSKMTPGLWRIVDMLGYPNAGRLPATNHPLYDLLHSPNDWQTWPEFCRMMMVGYLLRGNAYAVILRDNGGQPKVLVPINPDRVQLWESPSGAIFYMVTRAGLHEMAVLKSQPLLIPEEDIFHLKDLSANGLVGMSRIAIAREAIAISLGMQMQQARLIGNGARPSGVLSTDKTMNDKTLDRIKADWIAFQSGLVNSGKTVILEQGLKWQQLSLSAADMQFIQSMNFQLQEICRMFRVPPRMIGDMTKGPRGNITEESQDYRNSVLTSHSDIWEARFDKKFELRKSNLAVHMDEKRLLQGNQTARFANHRTGILSGFVKPNEARIAEGMNPVEGGDQLYPPANLAAVGSDTTGGGADGGGRPSNDGTGADQVLPDDVDQTPEA